MSMRNFLVVVSFTVLISLTAAGSARAQLTQPQLRELVRQALRENTIRHGEVSIDYTGRDVEINLGWVEIDDPDRLWYFPYSDQCLVDLIRTKYEKNPGEALTWQPYLKQAEALIAKEVALLQAFEKERAARPPAAQAVGQTQLGAEPAGAKVAPVRSPRNAPGSSRGAPDAPRNTTPKKLAPPAPSASAKESALLPSSLTKAAGATTENQLAQAPRGAGQRAPAAPSATEAAPAPPAPQADPEPAPAPVGDDLVPADDFPDIEAHVRDFPLWPQLEDDLPYEEMQIARALNDISYGVERVLLSRIDAEAFRQQKIVRYVEMPRGTALPSYAVAVRTAPPGAAVYYLNELAFARYARDGSIDNVARFWTAAGGASVQLAGKWRFVAVWPDGRRSAMQQFHITKENAIELTPEARTPAKP